MLDILQRDSDATPRAVPALPLFSQPLRDAREAFERQYFEHHLKNERGNIPGLPNELATLERTHLALNSNSWTQRGRRRRGRTVSDPRRTERALT